MKTAEEILSEVDLITDVNDSRTFFTYDQVLESMKLYANQKLDESEKEIIRLREVIEILKGGFGYYKDKMQNKGLFLDALKMLNASTEKPFISLKDKV